MSDDPNAVATPATGGAPPAAATATATATPPPAATPAVNDPPALLGGVDDAGDAADTPAATTTWPEDWREKWAGKDDKLLARLKRFASPDNVFKSYLDIERKVRGGQYQPALPDGAAPEEIAAYRKQAGIPEAPDGYKIGFAEGAQVPESAKAQLDAWRQHMHNANTPPQYVEAAWEGYRAVQEAEAQRRYEAAQEKLVETKSLLRSEWGRDYDTNNTRANNLIADYGGDAAGDMMKWVLLDGTPLGAHPEFVKMMVNIALATGGDDYSRQESVMGGKTLDDDLEEQRELRRTNLREYDKPENETKRTKIYAELAKRDAAAANRGRAA